jgi:hypothetical protein
VNEPGYLCTNGMSNSSTARATPTRLAGRSTRAEGRPAPASSASASSSAFSRPAAGLQRRRSARATSWPGGGAAAGRSSYRFGARPARLDALLPEPVLAALRHALVRFERTLPGYAGAEGLLVGIESRSSGPVRIPRDPETLRARGFANLFPVGEGAGSAGGIMSAAIDGARAAQALLRDGV